MANFMSSELVFRMLVTFTISMFLVNFYFQYKINQAQMQINAAQMELNKSQAALNKAQGELNKAQGELNDSVPRLTLTIKDTQHIVKGP